MSRHTGRPWIWVAVVILGWLVLSGVLGPLSGKLSSVQKNDNAAFLPPSAEATKALELQKKFQAQNVFPAIVVYTRDGGVTAADRARVASHREQFSRLAHLAGEPSPVIASRDGKALQVVVPLIAQNGLKIADDVGAVRRIASDSGGMVTHVTGVAGLQADFADVFKGIDTQLILTTAVVVVVILLLVYRSPFLWLVPLLAAALSLSTAQAMVYLMAKAGWITVNGQSQGILTVLVFGAGTDYALLLVSRYREELHNRESKYDAMRVAWRGSAPAIIASGLTVIAGLLCLLFSELNSIKGLGPVAAIGVAAAMLVELTFLPALLLITRRVFWPFVPRFGEPSHQATGVWSRVAGGIGRRPRSVWVITTVGLLGLVAGLVQLDARGIAQSEAFTKKVDSVQGQKLLAKHYPAGSGSPAVVIGKAGQADALLRAVRGVDGVAGAAFRTAQQGQPAGPSAQPLVVGGLVELDATLANAADSRAAARTVKRLRDTVHAVPGADAKVGGFTAVNLDVQAASQRDRTVIIPIVLLVIFLILALLLRALVAPVLLIATVVLSFFATLGACGLAFRNAFDFPGEDSSFPLFAFVFLVALGIDYNIFLMTRVREEAQKHGTRPGVLRGLTVTGGVITSAGVVLAATFSVLGVLPLVFLAQLGFAVAFGVLLDTLVVRSLLVPALTYDVGRWVWWPGRLARVPDEAPGTAAGELAAAEGRS